MVRKLIETLALITLVVGLVAPAQSAAEPATTARAGVCEGEAEKIVGQKAVRIGGSIRPPRRLRWLPPIFPELPPGTTAMGMWVGDVLVDRSGKVARVWATREVRLKPAFPALNQAVVDALGQWEYQPLLLNGTPTPFCMTVTTNIDFQ
jgi:hypothetical protein